MSSLSSDQRIDMGRKFIEDTQMHRGNAPMFTDKMPNNFRHIGLIHLIMPNAKIIDARRYPLIAVLVCSSSYLLKVKNLHMA